MKKLILSFVILSLPLSSVLKAQFDDLYYDPESGNTEYYEEYSEDDYYEDYDDYNYDDEYEDYDYYSEYDNYYSSRIRRFRRPGVNLGFYSGYACNSVFYDPFDWYINPYVFNSADYWYRGGSYVRIGFGIPFWSNYWRPNYYAGYYNGWPGYWYGNYRFTRYYNNWNNCVGYNTPWYANNNRVVSSNIYPSGTNPKGEYYGSRRNGATSSSIRGERERPPRQELVETRNHNAPGSTISQESRIQEERKSNLVESRYQSTRPASRKSEVSRQEDYTSRTPERATRSSRAERKYESRNSERSTRAARSTESTRPSRSFNRPSESTRPSRSGNSSGFSRSNSSRNASGFSRSSRSRSSGTFSRSNSSSRSSGASSRSSGSRSGGSSKGGGSRRGG